MNLYKSFIKLFFYGTLISSTVLICHIQFTNNETPLLLELINSFFVLAWLGASIDYYSVKVNKLERSNKNLRSHNLKLEAQNKLLYDKNQKLIKEADLTNFE